MIRLMNNVAERLLMCLVWVNDAELTPKQINKNAYDRYYGTKKSLTGQEVQTGRVIREILDHYGLGAGPTPAEMIDIIVASLQAQHDETRKDGDLIDLIVDTLKLQNAKNVLAGGNIDALRKAILLPSERATALETIRIREMSCSGCGRKFLDGEMTAYSTTEGFQCFQCWNPTQLPCREPDCDASIPIPPKLVKGLDQVRKCVHHTKKPGAPDVAPTPPDIVPLEAAVARLGRELRNNDRPRMGDLFTIHTTANHAQPTTATDNNWEEPDLVAWHTNQALQAPQPPPNTNRDMNNRRPGVVAAPNLTRPQPMWAAEEDRPRTPVFFDEPPTLMPEEDIHTAERAAARRERAFADLMDTVGFRAGLNRAAQHDEEAAEIVDGAAGDGAGGEEEEP